MPTGIREPIIPHVPEVIRAQATPVELYTLERISTAEQLNERIVLCLEDLHRSQQSDATRLAAVESRGDEHHRDIAAFNRRWKTMIGVFVLIGPVVLIVLEKIASRIWP